MQSGAYSGGGGNRFWGAIAPPGFQKENKKREKRGEKEKMKEKGEQREK